MTRRDDKSVKTDSDPRVLLALDYESAALAIQLVDQLSPEQCALKVGKELFTREGPAFVKSLVEKGFRVFLDLKFHDIPNTVAKAVKAAAELGVWMVNVHASGGEAMMKAAKQALEGMPDRPLLIAVTVLTSASEEELAAININVPVREQVLHLAGLAQKCGLDGVVCSAAEASLLRQALGDSFVLVTPGIRPADASNDDQKRVVTPEEAVKLGASYLVIGRPVTKSDNPCQTLLTINEAISYKQN